MISSAEIRWSRLSTRAVDRWSKRGAMGACRSQVGPLDPSPRVGRELDRVLWHEIAHGGEAITWSTERSP